MNCPVMRVSADCRQCGAEAQETCRAEYEERAAIMEHDGKVSRSQAEIWARARQLLLAQRRQRGQMVLPTGDAC
jgi:hypothetical protein